MSVIACGFSKNDEYDYDKLKEKLSNIAKEYDYRVLYNLSDKEIIGWNIIEVMKVAYKYLKWDFIAIIIAPASYKGPAEGPWPQPAYGIDEEMDNFIFHNGIRPPFLDFLHSICSLFSTFLEEINFFFGEEIDEFYSNNYVIKQEGSLDKLIARLEYANWHLSLYDLEQGVYFESDYPLIFTVQLWGKDLFRIRRKGHPKGSKNASKTEYIENINPKTGKVRYGEKDKASPITNKDIKMIKKALKGKDGYNIRTRKDKNKN